MAEKSIDPDSELIEKAKKGDKQAFDALVIKHQYKILKLVSRYIDDPSEALDIAQDSFIRAYSSINKFRGDSSFYTWIYRISSNVAKNHLVAQGRKVPDIDIDIAEMEQKVSKKLQRELPTPEGVLLDNEVNVALHSVIDALPEELKTAILLREVEGMSYNDIANIMECPIGTVRSRIFRAREIIEKRVEPFISKSNYFGRLE